MKVLELYSGIGGMHLALKASGIDGEIVASIDINTVANSVYKYNFPKTTLLNKNIQSLSINFINNLEVDTILMSPPCQPFTRNGLKMDTVDKRTCSFHHILEILPEICIKYILIENVKGFEVSNMRNKLIEKLVESGFTYDEYILTPTQVGVPNCRNRYYCLARKDRSKFSGSLKYKLPNYEEPLPFTICNILEPKTSYEEFYISEEILNKRRNVLDICHANSKKSCCFTKGYGRYVKGTGSVLTDKSEQEVTDAYQTVNEDPHNLSDICSLNLRFFTPKEVCRLMCFPETFQFPPSINNRQKYMLLGNSINVRVVAELIKVLHC